MPSHMPEVVMARPLRPMHHRGIVGAHQLPPRHLQPQTKVDILAVHTIAFVESSDAGISLTAQQEKSAVDPVWLISGAQLRPPISTQIALKQSSRCGQQTLMILPEASRVDLNRIASTHARSVLHHAPQQRIEGITAQSDVGIRYDKHLAGPPLRIQRKGLIVIGAKTLWSCVFKSFERKRPGAPAQQCDQVGFGQVQGENHASQTHVAQ